MKILQYNNIFILLTCIKGVNVILVLSEGLVDSAVVSNVLKGVLKLCFVMLLKNVVILVLIPLVCFESVEMLWTFVSLHKNIFMNEKSLFDILFKVHLKLRLLHLSLLAFMRLWLDWIVGKLFSVWMVCGVVSYWFCLSIKYFIDSDVNLKCGHKRLSDTLQKFLVPLERSGCKLASIPQIEIRSLVSVFWVMGWFVWL